MTKRNRALYKFQNAMRALRGSGYTQPQKMAAARVQRWLTRCNELGLVVDQRK